MKRNSNNVWLNRFALATVAATFCLIGVGGLVTSHGAGMAVPDWPTSYGYNMFLFPISKWVGGIFYEHTHRLVASGVGLLTTILMIWLLVKEERVWIRWLGVLAFFMVVLQGVLGGLRVTLFKNQIGIFHATLAQLFLCMLGLLALMTSGLWARLRASDCQATLKQGRFCLAVSGLILLQLILGASMRHQHAGLAVPDFPLAYGKVWPKTDPASLAAINQTRMDARDFGSVTAFQIHLHMTHRILAVLVLLAVGAAFHRVSRDPRLPAFSRSLAHGWAGLVLFQALLGAATVWSNKAADIATAHVVTGAAILLTGALLSASLFRAAWASHNQSLNCPAEVLPNVSIAS